MRREHTMDDAVLGYSHDPTTFPRLLHSRLLFKKLPRYSERLLMQHYECIGHFFRKYLSKVWRERATRGTRNVLGRETNLYSLHYSRQRFSLFDKFSAVNKHICLWSCLDFKCSFIIISVTSLSLLVLSLINHGTHTYLMSSLLYIYLGKTAACMQRVKK